jgi:hypothetical protein
MANWKLRELRDGRRRNFLKMCTVAAAAVGVSRTRLLDFLADEGGYGLAEAAGATYGRSLVVPCPNGVFAWFQELWPQVDVAMRACEHKVIAGLSSTFVTPVNTTGDPGYGVFSSYLYTSQYGYTPANGYRGTYTPGKGVSMPPLPAGVKGWAGGHRPFFYGPDAPWFDHQAGVPKRPVTALMAGGDETHTEFPISATTVSGTSTLLASLASLGASSSAAAVPAIGIDPVKYGRAPGAPDIATVPSANGMIDLFNSAASQLTLASKADQEIFEDYFKAVIALRKSASRTTWAPQLAVTKNAARIIGLNFAAQLTPTAQDLVAYGIQELIDSSLASPTYLKPKQRERLEEFGRVLIVVAKAFALGLSKTAVVSLSPGPTSDQDFTDPHDVFNTPADLRMGRNTTRHLGKMLDAFYEHLAQFNDPEDPNQKLDQTTSFVAFGDTPHTPLQGNNWPDATPDSCNWLYLMNPKGLVQNGWFGQCVTTPIQGRRGFGYDPLTGKDAPTQATSLVTKFSTTAAVYAVAGGDKNKTAEYGTPASALPAILV